MTDLEPDPDMLAAVVTLLALTDSQADCREILDAAADAWAALMDDVLRGEP